MTTTTSRIDVEQAAPELYRAMLRLDGAVGKSGLDPQLPGPPQVPRRADERLRLLHGHARPRRGRRRRAARAAVRRRGLARGRRPVRRARARGARPDGGDDRDRRPRRLRRGLRRGRRALLRGRARGAHLPQHDHQRLDTARGGREADARETPDLAARARKRCAPCIAPARRSCCATRGTRPAPRRWSPTRPRWPPPAWAWPRRSATTTAATSPPTEAFAALARIVAAVDVPVTADCEAGYGLGARGVRRRPARRRRGRLQPRGHRSRHRARLRDPGEQAAYLAAVKDAGRERGRRRRPQRARRRARARRHARGRPRARPRLSRGGRRLRLPDLLPRRGGHRRLRRGGRVVNVHVHAVRARPRADGASSASRARASAAACSAPRWRRRASYEP